MKHFSEDFVLLSKISFEIMKNGLRVIETKKLFADRKTNNSGIIKYIYIKDFDFKIFKSFSTSNENVFYIEFPAYDFKEKINLSLKNGNLSKENKENLQKLNSEISEDDNPILLLGKFK